MAIPASAPPGFGGYQDPSTGIPKIGRTPAGGTYIIPGSYTKPPGGEYDPVQQQWMRTPASAGQRAGEFTSAYLDQVPSLTGLAGGGTAPGAGGVAGTAPTGAGGTGAPASASASGAPAVPTPPDASAATSAAFAKAKDQAGQLARASLTSLSGELGATGAMGGGAQAQGTEDILGQTRNALGDVSRQEAVTNAGTAADFAKMGYEGALTTRGQDIQQEEAGAQLALARSNAERQQQMQMLQLALTGLRGGSPSGLVY